MAELVDKKVTIGGKKRPSVVAMATNGDKRGESLPECMETFEALGETAVLRQKIPIITLLSTIEATNKMNSTELRLRRWFKCTKFEDKCFATRNTCQQFLSHLADKHKEDHIYCLYCSSTSGADHKQYYTHEDLVEHIRLTHSYRQFQCNLCLYRSVSVDHIFIHQKSVHSRNFETTVQKTEPVGDDHTEQLYIKQNQTIKECKILECTQLAEEPMPDIDYYYKNFKHKRINGELSAHQCLYCPYLDNSKEELYAHCAAAHPDYPLLIYAGSGARNSVNGDKGDNGITETVERTRSSKKRSFEESFSDSDVTTNGVVDTYEFDVWTESEDEDMVLTEDDLSADIEAVKTTEPVAKRLKTDEPKPKIADVLKAGERPIVGIERTRLQQAPIYLAAVVSAVMALYFSFATMTGP